MEGFLSKQGEKGLVVNLWRKRWFQLDTTALRIYYYKTKSKEELLGSINLAEGTLTLLLLLQPNLASQTPKAIMLHCRINSSLFSLVPSFQPRMSYQQNQKMHSASQYA